MDSLGTGSGIPDDEEELTRPRIGRPGPSSSSPPLVLRGVGASANPSPTTQRRIGDEAELQRKETTGSGISQIQHGSPEGGIGIAKPHPILGGILRGLNTVGSIAGAVSPLAHNIMTAIPGTEEHHSSLLGQQRGRIGEDVAQEKEEAQTAEAGARTGQAEATTEHERAATDALQHPEIKPKEEKWGDYPGWTDTDGTPLIREESSGQVVRASDKKPPKGFQPAKPAVDKQDSTMKVTRVVNGVPHEVLVNGRTGEDIKDEGQTKVPGESSGDKRKANESAQVERESRQNIRKAADQYRMTQQSVQQLTTSIDAAKDGNGLLTSFVPTMEVLGINASNGVHRISPAEAQAAGLPGGWGERFNAWFDKASTGQLSPQLQQEGKALAKILGDSAYQRYKSTYDDESGIVSGYGGTDFGKRVPLIQGGGGPTGTPSHSDPLGIR